MKSRQENSKDVIVDKTSCNLIVELCQIQNHHYLPPPAMTQAKVLGGDAVVGVFMWGRMCPITRLSQVTANATPPPPSSAPYYPQASTGVTTPDFYSITTPEIFLLQEQGGTHTYHEAMSFAFKLT